MRTCKEYRLAAKEALGDKIFGSIWPAAAVTLLVAELLSGFISIIPVVGTIAALVISGAISMGVHDIVLRLTRGEDSVNIGDVFNHFDGTSISIGLLTALYTFLWTMLFFIPGIIKSFSYSMAFFVHLDHPEFTANQCITESRRLMAGHRWKLFCLGLSYIGWMFVGAFCLGFGGYWVSAWSYTATAVFYTDLFATDSGTVVIEE